MMCDTLMIASTIDNATYLVLLDIWKDLYNMFIRLKTLLFDFIKDMVFCMVIDSMRMTQARKVILSMMLVFTLHCV